MFANFPRANGDQRSAHGDGDTFDHRCAHRDSRRAACLSIAAIHSVRSKHVDDYGE